MSSDLICYRQVNLDISERQNPSNIVVTTINRLNFSTTEQYSDGKEQFHTVESNLQFLT